MQFKTIKKYLWLPMVIVGIMLYFFLSKNHTQHDFSQIGGHFQANSTIGDFETKNFTDRTLFVFFGFSQCPDVCPITMAYLTKAQKTLAQRNIESTIVLVTSDPSTDDLPTLQKYLKKFEPLNAIGVSGTMEEMKNIAKLFKVSFDPVPAETQMQHDGDEQHHDPSLHTDRIFILGDNGRTKGIYTTKIPLDKFTHDVANL